MPFRKIYAVVVTAALLCPVSQVGDFCMFEEAFNQGYPQELKHFIDCVQHDREPLNPSSTTK